MERGSSGTHAIMTGGTVFDWCSSGLASSCGGGGLRRYLVTLSRLKLWGYLTSNLTVTPDRRLHPEYVSPLGDACST